MVVVVTSEQPSAARVHVGELIKGFRKRANLTQKDAAERLLISESLAGAYERAERIPTSDFLRDADKVLGAEGALMSCVRLMEEEKYPRTFIGWVRLERDARSIGAYENMLFPGLLQTEAYVRALYGVRVPSLSEGEIERNVQARLERQAVLRRDPLPVVAYVIDESVLQRPIGGREVLKEQLRHVAECVRAMQHLTVQVMPTELAVHAALQGPMQLLSTPEGRNFGYEEGQGSGTLISKPQDVNQWNDRFGALRAQALTPWESVDLIERMAGQL